MAQNTEAGLFVYHQEYGPARILEGSTRELSIELLHSPWLRETRSVLRTEVKRLYLQEQTRVYIKRRSQWRAGRVLTSDRSADGSFDYTVQLPNKVRDTYNERDLLVRCWLPHDDPTSALACGGMETQFFHERRVRFAKALINQRAACRGLAGIMSARVELVPHQVDVARRVLEDPLQRYLLADEVGMGKTIEAGFVVRQFLLTEAQGQVWVLVPGPLIEQWRRELSEKFAVEQFGDRVRLCVSDGTQLPDGLPALLILDEAHHLVTNEVPGWLEAIATTAERLLLLSATPSLRDPGTLLRLLRLLDPMIYGSVSLDAFQERLERQESFGVFVRGLRPDASPAVVRQRLRRIPELLAGDGTATACGDAIACALADGDSRALSLAMARLRSHIADVYRVHQRLIRSRRRDCPEWVFRPRGRLPDADGSSDGSHLRSTWIEDSRLERCFERLEEWRVDVASAIAPDAPERRDARESCCRLFEAFSCGIERFSIQIRATPSEWMPQATMAEFEQILGDCSEGEISRSAEIAAQLKRHIQGLQRMQPAHRPKLVVFGSADADLSDCGTALMKEFDQFAVVDARQFSAADDIAKQFRTDPNAFVLLCGPAHEEGLNLQFADVLVHLDLPLSPQRIEQRIGRLDRFGRSHNCVEQRFVFPSVDEERSPWEAWFDVLAQGYQVFNVSIADVQFVLGDTLEMAKDALFEHGAAGLRGAASTIRQRLEAERQTLDDHYALDRVLQEEDEAGEFFGHLEDTDASEGELGTATHDWLVHCLQFESQSHGPDTVIYRWDSGRTQLPELPWRQAFSGGLGRLTTTSRKVACAVSQGGRPQFLRLGSPLLLSSEQHLGWEDRGIAFATWRMVQDEDIGDYLAFKLTYVVEARLPAGMSRSEAASWRARIDGLLPPWQDVLYVNPDLQPIHDPRILGLLEQPYCGKDQRGSDYNLGSRIEALYAFIDAAQFESLCREVRARSEAMLRAYPAYQERVRQAIERGEAKLTQRIRRLKQRHAYVQEAGVHESLDREIQMHEEVVRTLSDPVIRLDATGAFVLSNRPPHDPNE